MPDVAWYYHNYIAEPAKWYDLGDALRQFATKVPELALDEPLLFSAVIALSAEHVSQTTGSKTARELAEFYHGQCVRRLIQLEDKSELLRNGVALATACLLRSYEILYEDIDPNRHLQGAYSLASCEDSISGSPPESLLAAGFWNYLREDITFSLFEGCPLKMDVTMAAAPSLTHNQDQLHSMSLILGQIINTAFGYRVSEKEWHRLVSMVQTWLDELPQQFKPFSRGRSVTPSTVGELPCSWFLQDFHASARQYALVSLSILAVFAPSDRFSILPTVCDDIYIAASKVNKSNLLETYALEICGIAFTTNIPSVLVNSFGPIAYCKKLSAACQLANGPWDGQFNA
ncbi:phytanoyl- dioxygenase [Trichoderma arundinaceum]|uniref:Phytanoyl-dioxygenase n=1 Tax=Trichoderma arundinaceum TaxID=490622 RepID=A0A395NKD7_TRIAR|nr:phytanoyl- dioxygenase [Trichoderma arundinaceum]